MDIAKPEELERTRETATSEAERAEVNFRAIERPKEQSTLSHEISFTDEAGRSITTKTWESGNQAYIRAYDTAASEVPKDVNPGQAGYANATLETAPDGHLRVRLNDIVTQADYRGAGVASNMIEQTEQFARSKGASEIYGSIDSADAQSYWQHQADKGWTIDYAKGAYGAVSKRL